MSETLVRDKIFVSYSHEDSWWLKEFMRMMTPQVRSGKLLIWSDTSIPTGSHWREEINKALSESRVAVLAISDHFMHSDFIHKIELPSLLLAAQEDGVRICWCLLSACIFEDTTIGSLQAAHDISKSFDKMGPAQRKETLKSVAKSVMSLYENISPSISWQENEASGPSDNAHSRKSQTSVLTATDVAIVELRINRDFDDFSHKDQELLLQGIAQILKVSDAEIRIRNKRRGSVIVNLELSTVLAEKLLIAAREGKLERLGIIKANLTNQGSNVEIESLFTTSTSHHHTPVITGLLNVSALLAQGHEMARFHHVLYEDIPAAAIVMTHPQPNLRLAPQEKPKQKISLYRMPTSVHTPLAERAGKLNRNVSSYCRIIIEHALANRKDYEGPLTTSYMDNPCHNEAIHIPIRSKKIIEELFAWDPFGVGRRTEIAMSLLKKHLEVRDW
jgi:hypothetical protein